MHLEHLNLVVKDIKESLAFYRAAFPHWHIRAKGVDDWYGKTRTWVHFGDDYQYLSLNDSGEGKNRDLSGHSVGLAHIAYVTDDIDGVITRLREAGYNLVNSGAKEPFRRNAYFIDPDGFEVEFVQYFSDIPEQRNLAPKEVLLAAQVENKQ